MSHTGQLSSQAITCLICRQQLIQDPCPMYNSRHHRAICSTFFTRGFETPAAKPTAAVRNGRSYMANETSSMGRGRLMGDEPVWKAAAFNQQLLHAFHISSQHYWADSESLSCSISNVKKFFTLYFLCFVRKKDLVVPFATELD